MSRQEGDGWLWIYDEDRGQVHITPIDDLMIHSETDDWCNCTPCSEEIQTNAGVVVMYVHHSLDGREVPRIITVNLALAYNALAGLGLAGALIGAVKLWQLVRR